MKITVSLALMLLLAACAASKPSDPPVQRFVPLSRATEQWGAIEFSDRVLRFENFQGEMQLKYAGRMSEAAGTELEGAAVYQVGNAQKFFDANQAHEGQPFCTEPARWVAVNSKNGAPAWSGEIWLSLLTIEDWAKYTPDAQGHCAGGSYVRAQ